MKTAPTAEITVAQLRQNPTAALDEVAAGASLVVTRHRRPIARLVPPDDEALLRIVPAKDPGPSSLLLRAPAGLHTYEDTEALLAEMDSEW